MPREEELPPNKRIDFLVTEITGDMWAQFDLNEGTDIRDEKIVSFLIRKIAELQYEIEEIKSNGLS